MKITPKRFFEDAIALSGCRNQAALVRKLGIKSPTYTQWRKGDSLPGEKRMMQLAKLCNLDPEETLIILNLWRCDEAARSTYEKIFQQISGTKTLLLALFIGISITFSPLETLAKSVEVPKVEQLTHHYEKLIAAIIRWFGSRFAFVFNLCAQRLPNTRRPNRSQRPSVWRFSMTT